MPAQKYEEIYKDLKTQIEDGVYKPQDLLPSENTLTEVYGCSRNTVRRAISMLVSDAYVQSVHGKGVIVIYQRLEQQLYSISGIESLKEAAARNHKPYKTKIIHFAEFTVDERLHRRTGFAVGDEVYYVQRVRYFDNVPIILDNNWFLKSVVCDLTPEICEQSVYEYMENVLGETIVTAKRRMTVDKVTQIDEKYLDLGDYNCLAVVTGWTYNKDGVMFEYTQSRHRPDKFEFDTQAQRVRPV